ncbi:MAG: transcriptional regulator [Promethearchaeota archaeon]
MDLDQFLSNILDKSKELNSNVFSITRCILLALSSYFIDGIQYRDLKAGLKISDGKLASNLNFLEKMDYLSKEKVKLDNKNIQIYTITDNGKKELNKILNWIDLIKKLLERITLE